MQEMFTTPEMRKFYRVHMLPWLENIKMLQMERDNLRKIGTVIGKSQASGDLGQNIQKIDIELQNIENQYMQMIDTAFEGSPVCELMKLIAEDLRKS